MPLTDRIRVSARELQAAVDDNMFSEKERKWIETVRAHRVKEPTRPLSDVVGPNVRTYKKQVKAKTKKLVASLVYVLPVLNEFDDAALEEMLLGGGMIGGLVGWSVSRRGDMHARVLASMIERGLNAWIAREQSEFTDAIDVRVLVDVRLKGLDRLAREPATAAMPSH